MLPSSVQGSIHKVNRRQARQGELRSKRRSSGGEGALGYKVNRRQAREGALGYSVSRKAGAAPFRVTHSHSGQSFCKTIGRPNQGIGHGRVAG